MNNRRNTIYALLIVTLLTGLLTGRAFFFNIAYLLGGLLFVSFLWSWTAVRWLTITRKTRSRRAQVGRPFEETFIIRNSAFLPKLWLEVKDDSELPGHRASHIVPLLGARTSYRWYVDTVCLVRGEFQLGPITLTSGDPFGLYVSPRRIDSTQTLIVYPETVDIHKFDLPAGILSGGEAKRQRSYNVTTNAAGVREYAPGDSFNRIHWASSARKNQLMVKEFEIDPLSDLWMLVDFSAQSLVEDPSVRRIRQIGPIIPDHIGIPFSTEEYAAVVAASLAKHFIETERSLGFGAYLPHREIYQPERGLRQLYQILQALAVGRSLSPYTLDQVLTLESPHLSRGTTLLIVTASINERWISQAQILSRKGIRPSCVLIDPTSFGGAGNIDNAKAMLRIAKIPTRVVRRGDNIANVLELPAS